MEARMNVRVLYLALMAVICLAVMAGANTIALVGDYEQAPSDIVVLNSNHPDRTITYNVGVLQGNEINFVVRYGNLNALNTAFGDTVNTGGFRLYDGNNVLSEQNGISQGAFDQRSVSVGNLIHDGSLQLRLSLSDGSDPLTFYRPWLYITDSIPPAPTIDLAVSQSFSTALRLSWTASGDDGMIGNGAIFEVRYSKWPVDGDTLEWWGYAEQAANAPEPGAPGSHEMFLVGDLDTVSTYYFIVVTYDEVGNRSAFSNVATGTTGQGGLPDQNYCLEFNGTSTRAVIPNTEILNPSDAITIECWIYCHDLDRQTQGFIVGKSLPRYEYPFLEYAMAVTDIHSEYAAITTADGVWHKLDTGPIRLRVNEWTHLSYTYDGSMMRLYVNGQLNQTGYVNGQIINWPYNIYLGILEYLGSFGMDGLLDELRIWNFARTQSQIQSTMNQRLIGNEDGLIGYWNFDEGEGQAFFDATPYGSNGYLGSSPQEDQYDASWTVSTAPVDEIYSGTGPGSEIPLPQTVEINQNYPNPFNAETKISFSLPSESVVRLEVFDMLGRRVATLADGVMPAGRHDVTWNGRTDSGESLSSGMYFYRLKTDNCDLTKKMMMLK